MTSMVQMECYPSPYVRVNRNFGTTNIVNDTAQQRTQSETKHIS